MMILPRLIECLDVQWCDPEVGTNFILKKNKFKFSFFLFKIKRLHLIY